MEQGGEYLTGNRVEEDGASRQEEKFKRLTSLQARFHSPSIGSIVQAACFMVPDALNTKISKCF